MAITTATTTSLPNDATTTRQVVTVYGSTGVIGTALVIQLAEKHPDWTIQAVSRSSSPTSGSRLASLNLPNVTLVAGSTDSLEQVLQTTQDSTVIVCCVGFASYETRHWAEMWPPLLDRFLEATRHGQKRFVFCDTLYAYGTGSISHTKERVAPGTHSKMAVGALVRERLQRHMTEHPGTTSVVGASDFFGPHCYQSFLGSVIIEKVVNHQTPLAFGNNIHDFAFTPDFAAALALAVERPEVASDQFWIAPHSIHGKTMQQITDDVCKAAGIPPRKLTVLKPWQVHTLALFMGVMRSLKDMLEIWTSDYVVDDSDFIEKFGLTATGYEDAIQQTVAFFVRERDAKAKAKR